jgi:hypothetical protein
MGITECALLRAQVSEWKFHLIMYGFITAFLSLPEPPCAPGEFLLGLTLLSSFHLGFPCLLLSGVSVPRLCPKAFYIYFYFKI